MNQSISPGFTPHILNPQVQSITRIYKNERRGFFARNWLFVVLLLAAILAWAYVYAVRIHPSSPEPNAFVPIEPRGPAK